MRQKSPVIVFIFLCSILIFSLACNLILTSGNTPEAPANPAPSPQPQQVIPSPTEVESTATLFSGESNLPTIPPPTITPEIFHIVYPADSPDAGKVIYDVESSGTAPEKRAPYGDSYDINRFERPFDQNMDYIPDLDIITFSVFQDDTWVYVSIKLIGTDPNNQIGINYGVEVDTNVDGFGDYIVWGNPPYDSTWTTNGVQVFADTNRDTGGLSGEKSDAPIKTDGYDKKIFDSGVGDDPDLAWVRATTGAQATVDFAFKKSLVSKRYLVGVIADAGIKDVSKLDYVDRFTEEEAGSPERSEKYYPLKALYAVDNVCREAIGFTPTGYEPQICPSEAPKTGGGNKGCSNPSQYTDGASCIAAGCIWARNPNVVTAVVYHCTAP